MILITYFVQPSTSKMLSCPYVTPSRSRWRDNTRQGTCAGALAGPNDPGAPDSGTAGPEPLRVTAVSLADTPSLKDDHTATRNPFRGSPPVQGNRP